jgi:hypothetical protein
MPWDEEKQLAATLKYFEFMEEFNQRFGAWTGVLQSGADGTTALAAVDDTLTRWRAHVDGLRVTAQDVLNSPTMIDEIQRLVGQVAENEALLKELKSKAITREEQGESVNPKVRDSPWTNILGLDRTFRPATRTNIIIASIFFGVLALFTLVFLIYRMIMNPTPVTYTGTGEGAAGLMVGGGRRR